MGQIRDRFLVLKYSVCIQTSCDFYETYLAIHKQHRAPFAYKWSLKANKTQRASRGHYKSGTWLCSCKNVPAACSTNVFLLLGYLSYVAIYFIFMFLCTKWQLQVNPNSFFVNTLYFISAWCSRDFQFRFFFIIGFYLVLRCPQTYLLLTN